MNSVFPKSSKSIRLKSEIWNSGDQKSVVEIYGTAFKTHILKRKTYLKRICNLETQNVEDRGSPHLGLRVASSRWGSPLHTDKTIFPFPFTLNGI